MHQRIFNSSLKITPQRVPPQELDVLSAHREPLEKGPSRPAKDEKSSAEIEVCPRVTKVFSILASFLGGLTMKRVTRLILLIVFSLVAAELVFAQTQPNQKRRPLPKSQKAKPWSLENPMPQLRPEQVHLVDDFIRSYNATTGSNLVPQQAYDNARLSIRTTFDAVTHALLNAKMTDSQGKSLGRAIDLVEAVDEVMGEESGASGDHQFRLYVYLKPNAVDILSRSQEFFHDKDNTVYHKGFPICYRLKNGPPSIQFSISRDHKLSDVDVDYRSSGFPKGLVNGHLSAANSDVRAGNNLDRHDGRWSGLNGWWRDVFGQLGSGGKPPKETSHRAPRPHSLESRRESRSGRR